MAQTNFKSILLLPIMLLMLLQLVGSDEVEGDYYTSISKLHELISSEEYLLETLENYLKRVQLTNRRIERFLNEVEANLKAAKKNPIEFYEDPLNAFKAIKRLAIDWGGMQQMVLLDRDVAAYATNVSQMVTLNYANATSADLVGASKGLVRLQHTYALDSADIAEGVLLDYEYQTPLTADDCFVLGKSLYHAKDFYNAADWFLQARILLYVELEENDITDEKITDDFPFVSDIEILEYLAVTMYNIGNRKMAVIFNNELLTLEPDNEIALKNKEFFVTQLAAERRAQIEAENQAPAKPKKTETEKLYEEVCRGEVRQTPREQRDLRCRYVSNNVPFCLLAPFKFEQLSQDPYVALYHDSIYDKEMESIINATESAVERSKVGDLQNSRFSDIRTSQNTWLYYNTNSFLNGIQQRLLDITGLNLDYAEPLQVANYGIGGHYGPHYDFSEIPDAYPGKGNRILTALFYINEVELGGATAFPFLHLAVPPIKGSLVVWYNMHKSLELDYRTRHAGCPVLKGSKWICNEWFHEMGQEFTRPCSVKRDGNISLPFRELY